VRRQCQVAHQVGIGRDRVQQHLLLGVGQGRALGLDVGLRRFGGGHRRAAAEDRLCRLQQRHTAIEKK
jgi:hypothetical protein